MDAAVGQRCPECSRPSERTRVISGREAFSPRLSRTPVTFGIIGAALVLFVVGFGSSSIDATLTEYLALGNFARSAQGFLLVGPLENVDAYRAFTSTLLHGSIMHVAFNMYALYLFGPRLEREAGTVPFSLLYLATAAAGSAAFLIMRSGEFTFAVGASGAIFGLLGVWLVALYRTRNTPAGSAMFRQLVILLAINAALPLFIPNVAWEAHAGGFVLGAAIGYLWGRYAAGRPNAAAIRSTIAGVALLAATAAVFLA